MTKKWSKNLLKLLKVRGKNAGRIRCMLFGHNFIGQYHDMTCLCCKISLEEYHD